MKKTVINPDNTITCGKCRESKDLIYFCKRPENNSYRGVCKMCSKGYKGSLFIKQSLIQERFSQGLKECGKCKEIKPLIEFNSDKYTKHGFTSSCKNCINIRVNKTSKQHSLKSKYGLTMEQYKNILETQNYCCSICNTDLNKLDIKMVHVDHCHLTNKVREILCMNCNLGLGYFKDNPETIYNSLVYIQKHQDDSGIEYCI